MWALILSTGTLKQRRDPRRANKKIPHYPGRLAQHVAARPNWLMNSSPFLTCSATKISTCLLVLSSALSRGNVFLSIRRRQILTTIVLRY